jgi:hypothetical protein
MNTAVTWEKGYKSYCGRGYFANKAEEVTLKLGEQLSREVSEARSRYGDKPVLI